MKKASLALLISASLVLAACGSDKKEEKADTAAADPAQATMTSYTTKAQQHSYALGASMGLFATQRLKEQRALDIEVDQAALEAGFDDAMAGKPQFTEVELQAYAQASDMELREKQTIKAEAAAEGIIAAGKAYLEENGKREGVTTTETGLQYEVLTAGEGESPKAEDTVTVHYKGTLLNGETFDSSYDRGEPTSFPLNRVIPGWTEGLQYMQVGAKYRFHIPSDLAYGSRQAGSIPSNSTLIFDVELLEITPAVAAE